MVSQSRRKYSSATGRVAEVRFIRAAEQLGFQVTKGSRKDDMHLHVDYWIAHGDSKQWGVDVKGTTYQTRYGVSSRMYKATQVGCTVAPIS